MTLCIRKVDKESNYFLFRYKQFFDIEGESGVVVRGIGTCVSLIPKPPNLQVPIPVSFPVTLEGVRPISIHADPLYVLYINPCRPTVRIVHQSMQTHCMYCTSDPLYVLYINPCRPTVCIVHQTHCTYCTSIHADPLYVLYINPCRPTVRIIHQSMQTHCMYCTYYVSLCMLYTQWNPLVMHIII